MNTDYDVRWDGKKYYYEHRRVAESAMRRPLKRGEEVHHVSGGRKDNRNCNLVVCSRAYHLLLERRTSALRTSGHVDWRWCRFCKQWDSPSSLYLHPSGREAFHRSCAARYKRERKLNAA